MDDFISIPTDCSAITFYTRIMIILMRAFSQCYGVFCGGVQSVMVKCGDFFLPSVHCFKMCGSRQFVRFCCVQI